MTCEHLMALVSLVTPSLNKIFGDLHSILAVLQQAICEMYMHTCKRS